MSEVQRGLPLPGGTADNNEQKARQTIRNMIDRGEPKRGTVDYPGQLKIWQDAMGVIADAEDQRKRQKSGGLR